VDFYGHWCVTPESKITPFAGAGDISTSGPGKDTLIVSRTASAGRNEKSYIGAAALGSHTQWLIESIYGCWRRVNVSLPLRIRKSTVFLRKIYGGDVRPTRKEHLG
jgi:hypothetical protein